MKHSIQVIIGGLGFIGSNLIRRFPESTKIICVDDGSNYAKPYFETHLKNRANFKVILDDINKQEIMNRVQALVGTHDVFIWNMAANSDIRKSVNSPILDFEKTLGTTISTIRLAKNLNTAGIVFASSSAVYGPPKGIDGFVNEQSDTCPISYYGSAKLSSEHFLRNLEALENIPIFIYRFANIVGAPATHGIIFDLMQDIKANKYNLMILGNGKQRKTYIGVESLIEDMFTITELGLPGIYNLGPGDTGTSVQEICEMIRDHVSPLVSLNYQGSIGGWPGDIPVILLDVSKRNTLIPNTLPSSLNSIHKAIHEIANQFSVKIRCGN